MILWHGSDIIYRNGRNKIVSPFFSKLSKQKGIGDNEYVEVTPKFIRLRKRYLDHNERSRFDKKKAMAMEEA
mgnify:CR=1 FL=1